MSEFYADDWLTIHGGDVRDILPELPADSVDCIVTSPPYWGLRDYGQDGQLGLEATPEEYVANLVGVFRELRRVLKPTGTAWLNLGDSYASTGGERTYGSSDNGTGRGPGTRRHDVAGNAMKPKDLVGIPWRVAFALQADGWWLRSDIIWSKPNPMPESVTDRPTKAHEYLFLLTKSARYYFDQEAVREENTSPEQLAHNLRYAKPYAAYDERTGPNGTGQPGNTNNTGIHSRPGGTGRNLRSVWTIATRPYPGAHFAVFPPELPERCIKAGSSERGVCPACGEPWVSVGKAKTIEWNPSCRHDRGCVPAVVLDPFAGSGTVGLVANRLSRRAILIDLNPEYLAQQMKRNAQVPLGV
jgi:site-specific DNA-methyltransferase (cytosine-N4-specific)